MITSGREALNQAAYDRALEALGSTYQRAFQAASGTTDPYGAHVEALAEGLEAALVAFMGWDQ